MKKLYYILLFMLSLVGSAQYGNAQIIVSENIAQDTALRQQQPWAKNITINADPRLAILVERHKNQQYGTRNMRGFRIQIYYGNDRAEAIKKKVDFMRRYPHIQTYMVYTQPQYRVKVGNFASRADAIDLYRETIALYGACIIVPDNVTINAADYYD